MRSIYLAAVLGTIACGTSYLPGPGRDGGTSSGGTTGSGHTTTSTSGGTTSATGSGQTTTSTSGGTTGATTGGGGGTSGGGATGTTSGTTTRLKGPLENAYPVYVRFGYPSYSKCTTTTGPFAPPPNDPCWFGGYIYRAIWNPGPPVCIPNPSDTFITSCPQFTNAVSEEKWNKFETIQFQTFEGVYDYDVYAASYPSGTTPSTPKYSLIASDATGLNYTLYNPDLDITYKVEVALDNPNDRSPDIKGEASLFGTSSYPGVLQQNTTRRCTAACAYYLPLNDGL